MRRAVRELSVLLLLSPALVAEETGNKHIRDGMEAFATSCGLAPKQYEQEEVVLTDGNYSGRWRRISLENEECADCYRVVRSWRSPSGTTLVKFELWNESGDWSHYLLYCFGTNGRLKNGLSNFNSANGWAVTAELVPRGRRVMRQGERFRDLEGWNVIERPSGVDEWQHHFQKVPNHLKLEQLPFAGFVR